MSRIEITHSRIDGFTIKATEEPVADFPYTASDFCKDIHDGHRVNFVTDNVAQNIKELEKLIGISGIYDCSVAKLLGTLQLKAEAVA